MTCKNSILKYIKGSGIDLSLVTTNAAKSTYSDWDYTKAYAINDYAVHGNHVYIAITANTNKIPYNNPLDWNSLGLTDDLLPFDDSVNTFTQRNNLLEYEFYTSNIYSLAILNLFCSLI